MTIIVAIKAEKDNSLVLASDTQISVGTGAYTLNQRKIYLHLSNKLLWAFSGEVAFKQLLFDKLEKELLCEAALDK